MKIIIGVDPDSKANGVAIYKDGKLHSLESMNTITLYNYLSEINDTPISPDITIHIENVCANNAVFMPKYSKNPIAEAKARGRTLGMCQHAQVEVERIAEYFGFPIVRHKISKSWKSTQSKPIFEAATGWKSRSNEDTRSAAYFGMLGVKSK